ncbi:MAG: tetratricopeptide repeat protein [Pseudonocardiaceae bacterium]|nr:tetratricopeptide repeat protein [Pseudonocardiaceae bacterium]
MTARPLPDRSRPALGLAIIALNEEASLPRLLASIEGAFDRVVLLDTGSKDRTIDVFQTWACGQPNVTFDVGHFKWVHDFSAARTAADELLGDVDWACWADCDDTIHGAQRLRDIAANLPAEVSAAIADYDYAFDHHGNVVCRLRRERLVRKGHGTWTGRVHEAQLIAGPSTVIDPELVRWVHHKQADGRPSSIRNLRILRAWVKDEPRNPRVLGYLGTEEAAAGRHARAVSFYRRYLKLKTGWDEERAQIHRKLACSLMALGRHQDAAETALAALAVLPDWPDSHLSLAEAMYSLGEHDKAAKWAREVLRLGHPDSLLILNPLDYHWKPKVVLAAALGALNRVDEALAVAKDALALVPDHEELRRHALGWQTTSERERVAATFVGCAQLLVKCDEQLKARTLLEGCVPYFATDHPDVVAARSQVRERLLWADDPALYAAHYRDGGSQPEDFHTDERALAVAERLPRAHFVLRNLAEMQSIELEEAA